MLTIRFHHLTLLCAVIGAILPVLSASGAIRADHRRLADTLARPVTLELERVYLGELVEKLSQLSGADLRLADRTVESGDPLCVVVRDMPLRQVMDLLTSLYSYKGGVWEWRKETVDGGDRYTLTPSHGARTLVAQLEAWTYRAYMRQLDTYRRTRDMTPEEQARLKEEDTLLSPFPTEEITRGEADLFLDALTDDQRLRVLRGEERPRIAAALLPASGRSFIDSIYSQLVRSARSQPNVPDPPPFEWVEFQRALAPGYATADVRVCLGDKIGFMFNTILGGKRMNAAFKKHVLGLWVGSDETAKSAAGEALVRAPEKPLAREAPWTLGGRLIELSRAASIPLLCRTQYEPAKDPGSAVGTSVAAFLSELDEKHAYMSKWRSDALLLSTYRWHLPEELSMRVGWEVVKGLKAGFAKNDGLFTVSELAATAHRLSARQLLGLGVEWPVFRHIARYHPIFALCGSPLVSSHMTSERGYAIKDDEMPVLAQCPELRRRVKTEGPHTLRIIESRGVAPLPPDAQSLRIQLKGPDGQWIDVGAFYTLPWAGQVKPGPQQ